MTCDESVSVCLISCSSPPAASVSVAVLPAAPVQQCSESDPSGPSLQTDACCLLRSSASDVQPEEKGAFITQKKHCNESYVMICWLTISSVGK